MCATVTPLISSCPNDVSVAPGICVKKVEEVSLKQAAPCFLCAMPIPPGTAMRVRWGPIPGEASGTVVLYGYVHPYLCAVALQTWLET